MDPHHWRDIRIFVPGRSITNNVLIAVELIHYMKMENYSQVGEVALKIDRSKAYDHIFWDYLWRKW